MTATPTDRATGSNRLSDWLGRGFQAYFDQWQAWLLLLLPTVAAVGLITWIVTSFV